MVNMKYFKIVHGYNQDEYIPINENELAKAIAIFMEGSGRAMFENGAIRGQDIMRIVPDWHTAMGWNKGYKMTTEDHAEIGHLDSEYRKIYLVAKAVAEMAISQQKPELLKLPLSESIKSLPKQESPKQLVDQINTLSNSKRVI